jgi:hypothetical protein
VATEIHWPVKEPETEDVTPMPEGTHQDQQEGFPSLPDVTGMPVGEGIYTQVMALEKDGGLSRQSAFQVIADVTGRRAGTVAANFYRILRTKEAEVPKRGRPRGGGKQREGAKQDTVASTVREARQGLKALGALVDLVESQEAELRSLRKDAEKVRKVAALLG